MNETTGRIEILPHEWRCKFHFCHKILFFLFYKNTIRIKYENFVNFESNIYIGNTIHVIIKIRIVDEIIHWESWVQNFLKLRNNRFCFFNFDSYFPCVRNNTFISFISRTISRITPCIKWNFICYQSIIRIDERVIYLINWDIIFQELKGSVYFKDGMAVRII